MKFQVTGADQSTGNDRDLVVEAEDEGAALLAAKAHGIFPYKVKEILEAVAPHEISMSGLPHWGPKKQRERQESVVNGLALLGVIAIVVFGYTCLSAWLMSPSALKPDNHVPATTSPFANDDERLEWRSRNRLPMTDEDVKYQQRKIVEAERLFEQSQRRSGR